MVLSRTAFIALAVAMTAPFWIGPWAGLSLWATSGLAGLVALFVIASAAAVLPSTRGELQVLRAAAV